MGEALVKLAGKVRVKAHLAKRGKKVVPVVSYVREQDLVFKVTEYQFSELTRSIIITGYLRDDPQVSGSLALVDETPEVWQVGSVNTTPRAQGRGIATQLALEFHRRYPHFTLKHGGFGSQQGADWARFMVKTFPDWNDSTDIDAEMEHRRRMYEAAGYREVP